MTDAQPPNLAALAGDIDRIEGLFAGWEDSTRAVAEAYREAIEALHGEALRRLIAGLKTEPAALAALRRTAGDEIVYAVLRRHRILKPSVDERVEAALAGVSPSDARRARR